jgi:hypothetical protein
VLHPKKEFIMSRFLYAAALAALGLTLFPSASSSHQVQGKLAPSVPGTGPVSTREALGGASLAPVYSATGLVRLSVDALGTNDPSGGIVQVDKAAGATVRAAYLMAASTGFCSCTIPDGAITLAGNPIAWDGTVANAIFSNNYIADVTGIVAPIVDGAPAGLVDLSVAESDTGSVDGVILAVVLDDLSLSQNFTAVIFFGAQNIAGDDFAISLADPADPLNPDYKLDLSLGISFGFQDQFTTNQISTVDVNGTRMTSSAGGQADGVADNGVLMTAGGIGDSNANPADPNAPPDSDRYDDELYDLKPFVTAGDTLINVHTVNPSNDDNILFAGLVVSGAAVVGEGAILTPVSASNPTGTDHTVTATLVTTIGDPIVGRQVDFEVLSGPNVGLTGNDVSDVNGEATFTYSSILEGTDTIQASFLNGQGATVTSNTVTKEWHLYETFCVGDDKGVPCPCANNGNPGNGCANSDHPSGANLSADGIASLGNDTLVFTVKDQHAGSLTLLWQGDKEIAPLAQGDGLRCLNGLRRMYRAKNAHVEIVSFPPGTGPDETVSVSVRSANLGDPLSPGSVRGYFATYRDPANFACPVPATMNNTNAVRIVWAP